MLKGSMVALVTPMFDNDEVDDQKLKNLVEFHIQNQTDAIVAVGTTGESATLNEDDHCDVIRKVVGFANGKIPIIAGTGSNSTTEAIDLTLCAKEAGVDACLLVTPYYNKPTQLGLYLHHKKVAETVDIPQILYNVPGRTACDMLPETIKKLSGIPNIVGVKEATGDVDRARQIMALCTDDFAVYSGDDVTAMELILAGGHGTISVTANVAPRLVHDLCLAALAGKREVAEAINQKLDMLNHKLFVEANPIPVKWALYEMGMLGPGIRLPMTLLSEQYHEVIRKALAQAGVEY